MQIGIVANHSPEDERYWINTSYIDYFKTYGFVTLINPLEPEPEEVDLLILPGGADISPGRYGYPHLPHIGFPNRPYEMFDFQTLPEYIKKRIPIFGICRGHQSLNVYFGGTLHSHVDEPTSRYEGEAVHFVGNADKTDVMPTSSNHHQAVDRLGDGLVPLLYGYEMKVAKEDGKQVYKIGKRLHLEAMRHTNMPIASVQWHPEKNFAGQSNPSAEKYVRGLIHSILRK